MNIYNKIYIGIYKLFFQKVDVGEYSASILFSVLLTANLISVFGLLNIINVLDVKLQRIVGVITGIIFTVFNILYFNFSGRHQKLLKKIIKDKNADIIHVYAIAYLILSVIIFFLHRITIKKQITFSSREVIFISFSDESPPDCDEPAD